MTIKTNKAAKVGLALAILVSLLKISIIDIDLPRWFIAFYQPIDEFFYVYPAYNLYEYSSAFYKSTAHFFGIPVLTNLITYLSLNVFGDNYLGLRFSSVVFSIVSITFFTLLLKRLTQNNTLLILLPLFLAINFSFSLASIAVEPTIARIAIMLMVMYGLALFNDRNILNYVSIFVLSLSVVLLIAFSYPTNAFLLLGLFFSIVAFHYQAYSNLPFSTLLSKAFFTGIVMLAGSIAGAMLYILLTSLLGSDELGFMTHSGGDYSGRVGFTIVTLFHNVLNISKANIFLFNPVLLIVFITAAFLIIKNARQFTSWNKVLVITVSFTLAFLLQTLFINDYPQRKMILLLPLVLLLGAGALHFYKEFIHNRAKLKTGIYLAFVFLFILLLQVFYHKVSPFTWYIGLGFLTAGLIFLTFSGFLFQRLKLSNLIIIASVLLFIPEVAAIANYCFIKKTYHYKTALNKLTPLRNANFIGGVSMGFRAYNQIQPSVNPYLFYSNKELYWKTIKSMAAGNSETDYSIGYLEEKTEYEKIGFYPYQLLMKANETAYTKDVVIYKEAVK